MARMLVKFRTCFGVNGSMIHPTRFIGLLRRLFFSSGQLCACSNFTTTQKERWKHASVSLTAIVPSSTVFVNGSHKGLAGAWGPATAHIMLSKYCMWPDRREYPHTVDICKRQFWLFYCLESTALTVGEVEAGSHVAFRDSCPKAAHD